ncbi:50S ribosomal protein L29 [Chromatiales bacterium (ex Bugula neritina AB1)]|nr:50S ribosomal protein L29 [Chromatiales bacterium (ex Bugula neritina AB1)]
MKASDLREKAVAELEQELVALRKEQFNLRMQMGSGQGVRPHLFNEARKNIARVKTVIAEKQQASKAS